MSRWLGDLVRTMNQSGAREASATGGAVRNLRSLTLPAARFTELLFMPTFLPLRTFGKTPLRVTPLAIGCAELGSMPETFAYDVAEEQALATLRAFFQAPINFLD